MQCGGQVSEELTEQMTLFELRQKGLEVRQSEMFCSIKDSHQMLQQLREQTELVMQDMQNQVDLHSQTDSSTLMGQAVFSASLNDTATPGPFAACGGPTLARSGVITTNPR